MDYVKKCVNTRFELASSLLQDKWLDEQFETWTQIITARILSDPVFKQALLDSAGSPLFDPEEPVYATALTSTRKMCVLRKLLTWPSWITFPRVLHVDRCLSDWPRDYYIRTRNVSSRAAMATSPGFD